MLNEIQNDDPSFRKRLYTLVFLNIFLLFFTIGADLVRQTMSTESINNHEKAREMEQWLKNYDLSRHKNLLESVKKPLTRNDIEAAQQYYTNLFTTHNLVISQIANKQPVTSPATAETAKTDLKYVESKAEVIGNWENLCNYFKDFNNKYLASINELKITTDQSVFLKASITYRLYYQ